MAQPSSTSPRPNAGTSYLGVPLPADATPIGITGCTIYPSLDIVDLVTAVSGTAIHSLAIPASPAFFGIPFFQQGASLDPALNPFGAALSNALAAVVGNGTTPAAGHSVVPGRSSGRGAADSVRACARSLRSPSPRSPTSRT